jgi:hypothetical protein
VSRAELRARMVAAQAVLADYQTAVASAPLSLPPGRKWMLRLAVVLGELLDVLGQPGLLGAVLPAPAVTLVASDVAIVGSALEDASQHIRERAANCPDCEASPAELCDGCSDRLARAEAYDRLVLQPHFVMRPGVAVG